MEMKKDDDIFEKGFKAGAGGLIGILSVFAGLKLIVWFGSLFFLILLFLIGGITYPLRKTAEYISERNLSMTEKINRCKRFMRDDFTLVDSKGKAKLIGYDEPYYGSFFRILKLRKNQKLYSWELQSRCKQFVQKNGNWK